MNSKQSVKSRRRSKSNSPRYNRPPLKISPMTKQELFDALVTARNAFDAAADLYIESQTPQNQLALTIALRNLSVRERAWQQWVYDNTP